ncbi:Phytol kinase 1, chloroplastic [Datura stramonium]|uniref:Phytol kinase 1, chloroplastic n=1 Tax=Datura stramonium TaxID=4076 RepID=A0ABS8VN34_DATST|nr:Phytol kinase 1, chloroplastic [Datura stramonium]
MLSTPLFVSCFDNTSICVSLKNFQVFFGKSFDHRRRPGSGHPLRSSSSCTPPESASISHCDKPHWTLEPRLVIASAYALISTFDFLSERKLIEQFVGFYTGVEFTLCAPEGISCPSSLVIKTTLPQPQISWFLVDDSLLPKIAVPDDFQCEDWVRYLTEMPFWKCLQLIQEHLTEKGVKLPIKNRNRERGERLPGRFSVPFTNCLRLVIHGLSLATDEGLIKSVLGRKSDELLRGPLYYVLVFGTRRRFSFGESLILLEEGLGPQRSLIINRKVGLVVSPCLFSVSWYPLGCSIVPSLGIFSLGLGFNCRKSSCGVVASNYSGVSPYYWNCRR